jgi:hypothetical protein
MPDVLTPVGTHFFSPDQLQAALARTIPETDMDGHRGAAAAAIDADGVKVALVFTNSGGTLRIRTAYAHDWSGDNKVAGDILYRF